MDAERCCWYCACELDVGRYPFCCRPHHRKKWERRQKAIRNKLRGLGVSLADDFPTTVGNVLYDKKGRVRRFERFLAELDEGARRDAILAALQVKKGADWRVVLGASRFSLSRDQEQHGDAVAAVGALYERFGISPSP